jgi:nitrite reductase (NADH) large subunit
MEKFEPSGQTISADTGEAIPYDRLLIATGSTPYIPTDIEGCDADGVFALRTITNCITDIRFAGTYRIELNPDLMDYCV